MKQPIKWHEDCATNIQASIEREIKRLDEAGKRLDREIAELKLYRAQIEKAKSRGLDGFDVDRFGKVKG